MRCVITIPLRMICKFRAQLDARSQITHDISETAHHLPGVSLEFTLTFDMFWSIIEVPRAELTKIWRDITIISATSVITRQIQEIVWAKNPVMPPGLSVFGPFVNSTARQQLAFK